VSCCTSSPSFSLICRVVVQPQSVGSEFDAVSGRLIRAPLAPDLGGALDAGRRQQLCVRLTGNPPLLASTAAPCLSPLSPTHCLARCAAARCMLPDDMFAVSQDKSVLFWDRRGSRPTGSLGGLSAACSALAFDEVQRTMLFTGTETGVVSLHDIRNTKTPIASLVCSRCFVSLHSSCGGTTSELTRSVLCRSYRRRASTMCAVWSATLPWPVALWWPPIVRCFPSLCCNSVLRPLRRR
jgi:hypothetical protein